MKTPEEIKKGLAICRGAEISCRECPYDCSPNSCDGSPEEDAIEYINLLESRLAQVEMEKDAAVADIEKYKGCGICKFQDVQADCDSYQNCCKCDNTDCPCYGASVDDCWQWRGVCAENTKEE